MNKVVTQFDSELAAIRHQREMESLNSSPGIEVVVNAAASLANKLGLPIEGLFRAAFKSGHTPLETLIEQLEQAAFAQISRIDEQLEGQDSKLREFSERLNSSEAHVAYQNAVFHGLRTSDPGKQFRLGALTVVCIYGNHLRTEDLDDMMRAAVELNRADISLLKEIYQQQADGSRRQGFDLSGRMGSVAKLQSAALIQLRTPGLDSGANIVFLLPEGKEFYERLQEIPAKE